MASKATKRKIIIYENELDGIPDYEPQSPSEEEQEENNDIQIKPKRKQENKNVKFWVIILFVINFRRVTRGGRGKRSSLPFFEI